MTSSEPPLMQLPASLEIQRPGGGFSFLAHLLAVNAVSCVIPKGKQRNVTACCQCGGTIGPGRSGRRCKACRSGGEQ